MNKVYSQVRDTLIAGLIFLLPLLILLVLASKVLQFFTGFSTKVAAIFGLKSILGVSGGTVVGVIMLLLFCYLCGLLVRVAFFKRISKWVDEKLNAHVPGYRVYREMAYSKLEKQEEMLPYKSAAMLEEEGVQQPCFMMDSTASGEYILFVPSAGNVNEGAICVVSPGKVKLLPDTDMKKYQVAISNLGLGMGELIR